MQNEEMNNTEMAGFVKYRLVKDRFVLEPSFRLHLLLRFAGARMRRSHAGF